MCTLWTIIEGGLRMSKKSKIIICISAAVIFIVCLVAVIAVNSGKRNGPGETYKSIDEAEEKTAFGMEYPDRLLGVPATEFESNSGMIEVRYGEGSYVRKTLGVKDSSGVTEDFEEIEDVTVNGMQVTCKGSGGLVSLAVWNDNNFGFTVCVSEGIEKEEMTEYVISTK